MSVTYEQIKENLATHQRAIERVVRRAYRATTGRQADDTYRELSSDLLCRIVCARGKFEQIPGEQLMPLVSAHLAALDSVGRSSGDLNQNIHENEGSLRSFLCSCGLNEDEASIVLKNLYCW